MFPVVLHAFFPHDHNNHGSAIHDHDHVHDDTTENEAVKKTSDRTDVEGFSTSMKESTSIVESTTSANDISITTKDSPAEISAANNDIVQDEVEVVKDGGDYTTICGCIRLKNLPLFLSMNLGEMLHNFTDGIFVGAAYLGCGATMGNSVVLATILHEIPNQLAGYLVMVNQNGINPFVALALNFFFGLSILLGGLMVLTFNFSNVGIGSIFAIGGGIFLHVAISEMLGNAERNVKKPIHMLYVLLAFLFGAVLIGLVLIDHQHCGGH